MKYLCTSCNYVYDTALWDEEEEIQVWEELYECPVCEEYDSFQWINEEVNQIKSNTSLWLEAEHCPIIQINDDILYVIVWKWNRHSMGEDHKIASVSLYDEYWDLIEEKYLYDREEPEIEFDFDDLDEFEVRVKCSLHGVWSKKFKND